ncbi:SAM-dependent methyltransferase [Arthrobacter psychrolactophilus]|uniref:SAM-dependent methyltransferase n=1 Tax=Arthrobacter psychrolactophilus TaxID=92442 RepID=A0A2V5IP08_9MICC|nr:class I SAM-dependent methyltransferase [Arthrobacter psychrolactophilus]PYI37821.1 SAM-dependent methyltransferase [Arthrobacter psychrolactophilus]
MPSDAISPLLTLDGWELLSSLGPYREADSLKLNETLRKAGHSPELVAAALTQARLRSKAEAKFGEFAHQMLFTQAGLEQATRLSIAALHAQRFTTANITSVADLGCGLGADSLAMASLDIAVTAVEMDEITAACTTVNLMPFPHAKVICGKAEEVDLSGIEGVWLDPARRTTNTSGTTRLFDPEAFSPPLSFVESLADRGLAVGVKMGPGIPHEAVPETAEAQWISINGDVVEAGLYFNQLARPGIRRSALVIGKHGSAELTSAEKYEPLKQNAELGPVSNYLYEPDGAVIRAGLVADLARSLGAHLLDEHIAYLSSEEAIDTPFARGYKVLEVKPFNVKALKSWVKTNKIGVLDIKKRGISVTPEELRRQLLTGSGKGPNKATLILTRIGEDRVAVVVEPLGAGEL